MKISKIWQYDYQNKCDCSEDDKCGCSFPENMERSYTSQTRGKVRTAYEYTHMRVGSQAINFVAPAILPNGKRNKNFNFFEYISNGYSVLFFYNDNIWQSSSKNVNALNEIYSEFAKRYIKIIAVSAEFSIQDILLNTSNNIEKVNNVEFPLIDDSNQNISLEYGVLLPDGGAQTALFIVDTDFMIRFQAVYDDKLTCNFTEIIRVCDEIIKNDALNCNGLQCLTSKNSSQ